MRKWKQCIAAVLAALMLTALLPAAAFAADVDAAQSDPAFSLDAGVMDAGELGDVLALIPLEERTLEVDLSDYTPAELRMIKLSTIFAGANLPGDAVVAWTTNTYGDDYAVNGLNDAIDIVSAYNYYSNHTGKLNCVVGSGKQLDSSNIHYTVNIQFGDLRSWLDYTTNTASCPTWPKSVSCLMVPAPSTVR